MECNIAWLEVAEPAVVGKTPTELGGIGETLTFLVSHPTTDLLFIGTAEGKVVVWDPIQAAMMCAFQAHSKDVTRIVFDPSGRRFMTASVDGFLHWWDQQFSRGQGIAVGCPVYATAFSENGAQVAAGGEDMHLRVWNAQTGALLENFGGHTDPITACAYVGRTLVSGGNQGFLRNWDVGQRRCFRVHRAHEEHISQILVSPDGKSYYSASWDRTVKVWNLQHREKFAFPPGNQPITAISLRSDHKLLAAAYWDGTIRLWNVESGKIHDEFRAHDANLVACAFLPNSQRLVTASQDGTLRSWDPDEMGTNRYVNQHGGEVYALDYTPENTQALSGGYDGFLKLWDRSQRMETHAVDAGQPILSCAVSPDNMYWTAGTADGSIRLWNVQEQSFEADLKRHKGAVTGLRFLPGGRRLVSCSWDMKIHLWLLEARQVESTFEGHSREVETCDVTLDGRRMVSASWDGSARLWDLVRRKQRGVGTQIRELEGHRERVLCCAFSPNGEIIVTGGADRTLRIWPMDTAGEPEELLGHSGALSACRFSPDGRLLLSADRSGALVVWDFAHRQMLGDIRHAAAILSLAISPDGTQAMIGDDRGQIRFLHLDYPRGPVWIPSSCILKPPPIWRRGGPPTEIFEASCLYCGTTQGVQKKQLGGSWSCPRCGVEFMLCPRSLPPVEREA